MQPQAKQALPKAIADHGIPIQVNAAYRTIAQQMLLYKDRFNTPNPVALPGHSNHQTGLAINIDRLLKVLPKHSAKVPFRGALKGRNVSSLRTISRTVRRRRGKWLVIYIHS